MSGRPWYKRYGGDFVLGTMSLTLEEKGAYSLCLDLIYDRGGPIPDDARWLAGVCGVSIRKWAALRERLVETGKLVAEDGSLSNARADREIADATRSSGVFAENGAKGGRKRAENASKSSGSSDETPAETPNNNDLAQARLKPIQKPEPDKKPPKSPKGDDDGLFEEAWKAYPHARGRSSKLKARAAWLALKPTVQAALPAACSRYAAEGREPRGECGAPAMERWVRDARYADWIAEQPAEGVLPLVLPAREAPWAHRMRGWALNEFWDSDWGPRPGRNGCLVPSEYLDQPRPQPERRSA